MRILVDVSAGRTVAQTIRSLGHDSIFVSDVDARMADDQILSWAAREDRLLVTMDKDFGELIYRSGQFHSGVLLLRLEAAQSSEKAQVISEILTVHADELRGRFSVYQNGRLRIR